MELILTGRLARDEQIKLGVYEILRRRTSHYLLRSLIVPLLLVVYLELEHRWLLVQPQVLLLLGGAYLIGVATRYLISVITVFARAKPRQSDTTVIFKPDEISIETDHGRGVFPKGRINLTRTKLGVVAYTRRNTLLFLLPNRALTAEVLEKITSMHPIAG